MLIYKEKFSKRLKELIESNNVKLYIIAELVDMSVATISRYLSGNMTPKSPTVEVIAKYFNVSPLWLSGHDVKKEPLINLNDNIYDLVAYEVGYKKKLTATEKENIKLAICVALKIK